MPRRWRVVVELTMDIDPEKDVERYEGDTDEDIAMRALVERVKPALNELVGEGNPFAHYHILEQPKRVFDS